MSIDNRALAVTFIQEGDEGTARGLLVSSKQMTIEQAEDFIREVKAATAVATAESKTKTMTATATADSLALAAAPIETPNDVAFSDYQNYVKAIFRPGDTLCFVGIVHNPNKSEERVANDFVSFERAISREYFEHLHEQNEVGSIYVATNTFPASLIGSTTGRTQENVLDVRALQADVDYNGEATLDAIKSSTSLPQPSIVVESSPGKFQGIWLVDSISKADAKPLMQAIASEFHTDSAVAEVARVMRVPGFVNRKYESSPIAHTLVQTNTRYRREHFKVALPVMDVKQKNAEGWTKVIQLQHGQIYNQLVKLAGYYVREYNAGDPDVLYALLAQHCETAVDRDGITPFQCNMTQVRQYADKWAEEFETGEEYKARTQLTMSSPLAASQSVAQHQAQVDVTNWQSLFRSIGEMEDGPIDMIIEGALQEGTCFIGANPGDGKTLIALAFAKAICTGTPLFGVSQFHVSKPRPVIYLIPESRDRAFRKRCEAFRLPDDKAKFMTRTISGGVPLELCDPRLLEAVRQTKAVVFLDTASRFMKGSDENAAAQNRQLVNDVVALLAAGAVSVVLVHHATKAAKASGERMTLENMLRGTGDFGAMCDQAYGIRKDMTLYENGAGPMEIDLVSLKDREQIGGLTSIRLAASHKPPKRTFEDGAIHEHIAFVTSYIDTTGNFRVVSDSETANRAVQALETLVKNEPNISAEDAAEKLNTTKYRVKTELERLGYHRVKGGPGGASPWHKDVDGKCLFEKADAVEIKPAKKTFNLSITEAAQKLEAYLAGQGVVTQAEVHKWADKQGITDAVLMKAKKRVNVIVDKENGTWSLPAHDLARAF
jgi:hypothetical protein